MDFIDSTLLPHIMELLSREDSMCTTVEELTESVKDCVLEKHIHPFGTLEMAVRFALEVGFNMGIILFDDNVLPAPFYLKTKKPAPKKKYTTAQGRQAVKRVLAKSRAKPKSKDPGCARKRPGKKLVIGKQAANKTDREGAKQNPKTKSKKRCT